MNILDKNERLKKREERQRKKKEREEKEAIRLRNRFEAIRKEKKEVRRIITEWAIVLTIAMSIGFLISKYLFFMINVPTGSMIPTINIEDRIYVKRVFNFDKLKRGDIIVFLSSEDPKDNKEKPFVKRLIGLPGDVIEIKKGEVYVNGNLLKEDYVVRKDNEYSGSFKVPQGKFFFLGDNRVSSHDSRYWKDPYVDKSKIMAKAGLKIIPLKDFGFLK